MEKTLESIQRVLTGGGSQRRFLFSLIGSRKKFAEFVDRLRYASSKHEEDRIVQMKLTSFKNQLSQPNISLDEVEDCLLHAMYCETFGYSCSFAYIHSLKLAQQGNLHQKLIGYLAAIVFLHQNHELVVLLINTIQKDLKSSNVAEICMALTAVCHLISNEMVPAVQCLIEEKLNHSQPIVRKHAVLALQHCLNQSQNWHISLAAVPKLEKALTDKDLSVVTAAITALRQLIKKEPAQFVHLISSLVQIQSQLIHRKLPTEYEYHTIPSPWLQIQILQILAELGKYDLEKGVNIYPVIKETLQRAEVNQNITYAIIFECIETIISLQHDNEEVLLLALSSITKLLKSRSANLKYMGIKALAHVTKKVHPQYAIEHQKIIMECLHHPDISLQLQTLDLLYSMANPVNVQVICEKMMEYLKISTDTFSHKSIVNRIAQLALQFCPDTAWLITTTNSLFLIAKANVPTDIIYQLMEKLKEGNDKLKTFAFQSFSELCSKSALPSQLIHLASWVLGETWCYSITKDPHNAQNSLCMLLINHEEASEETQLWILSQMLKTVLYSGSVSKQMQSLVQKLSHNRRYKLAQQKANEILRIISSFQDILPLLTWTRKEKIDPTLSFMDEYVCRTLELGAEPYKPPSLLNPIDLPSTSDHTEEHLQLPSESISDVKSDSHSVIYSPSYHSLVSESIISQESPFKSSQIRTKNVWTREGRIKDRKSTTSPTVLLDSSQSTSSLEMTDSSEQQLCQALFAGISSRNVDSSKEIGTKLDKETTIQEGSANVSTGKQTKLDDDKSTSELTSSRLKQSASLEQEDSSEYSLQTDSVIILDDESSDTEFSKP